MTMDSNGVEAVGVMDELKTLLKDGTQAFDADSESEAEYETASDTPEDATESETEPDVDVVAKSVEKEDTSVVVHTSSTTTTMTTTVSKMETRVVHKEISTEALYPSVQRLLRSRPELRARHTEALYPAVRRLVLAVVRRAAPQPSVVVAEKVTLSVETPAVTASSVKTVATSIVVEHTEVSSSETTVATEAHTETEVAVKETEEVHAVVSTVESSTSIEVTKEAAVDELQSSTDVVEEKTAVVAAVESPIVPAAASVVDAKETVVDATPENSSKVSDEKATEPTSMDVPVQTSIEESTVDAVSEKITEEAVKTTAVDAVAKSIAEKIVAVEMTIDDVVEEPSTVKAEATEEKIVANEEVVNESVTETIATVTTVQKVETLVETAVIDKTEVESVDETVAAINQTETFTNTVATEKSEVVNETAVTKKTEVDEVVETVTTAKTETVVADVAETAVTAEAFVETITVNADHVESTEHAQASVDDAAGKVDNEDLVESFVESIAANIVEEKIHDSIVEPTSVDAVEAKEATVSTKEQSGEVVVDQAPASVSAEVTVNSADTKVAEVEQNVEINTVTSKTDKTVVETVNRDVAHTETSTKTTVEDKITASKETSVEVKKDIQVRGDLVARNSDSLYPSVMKLVTVKIDVVPAPPNEDESLELIAQKADSLYPSVRRLVLAKAENPSTVGVDIPPPALAATPVKPARKSFGLGSFLPKVPSILRKDSHKKVVSEQQNSTTSSRGSHHSDDNDGEQDGVSSLTEQPAKESTHVPLATRLRGLSIEASSIVRKFNGLRSTSSIGESPRNSLEGAPPLHQRRSVTSGNSSPTQEAEPETKVQRGACVATKFGTGTVLDIRDDGFYVVHLVPKGTAYLREEMIVREIKSIVGERVKTRWGLATVEQYFVDEDMYSIALDWRWDDDHVWRMKATTKKFEKISRSMSIVQNTKARFFEGYSTFRESASSGYANVAAKLNTTHKRPPQLPPQLPPQHPPQHSPQQTSHARVRGKSASTGNLGKALTPYGVCSVIEVRPDQFFVVETKCGATAYLNADSVKLLHRRTNFSAGDKVQTPYGNGEILIFREEDEVYEVKLDVSSTIDSSAPVLFITDAQAEALLSPVAAPTTVNRRLSTIFNMTRNSVFSASATVKASATEKLNSLSSVKTKMTTMAAIKMTKLNFKPNDRVITIYGSGFVVDARPLERIYKVRLRRLNTIGFFHESVLQAFPYERVTHFIVDGRTIPAPEMPKNMPEYKRRHIISETVRQARIGGL